MATANGSAPPVPLPKQAKRKPPVMDKLKVATNRRHPLHNNAQRLCRKRSTRDLGKLRDERTKDSFPPTDWTKFTGNASTQRSKGMFLEGGELVAAGRDGISAHDKMTKFLEVALGVNPDGLGSPAVGKFAYG